MSNKYAPPSTLLKSRENLQEICKNKTGIKKYEIFDIVINYVWLKILPILTGTVETKTQCIINLRELQGHISQLVTESFITDIIEVLKKEYPGVDFTYKETAGYDGTILERIIIMDWS